MQQFALEWQAWALSAIVGATVVAAVVVGLSRRSPLSALPLAHVAAAALIGVVTWDGLLNLPNLITSYSLTYTGIEGAPEQRAYQALVVASIVYVVAGALAVVGLLRRNAWAVALGIGVCVARLATAGIGVAQMLAYASEGPAEFTSHAITVGLHGAPAAVAIVLLVWPIVRNRAGPMRSELASANLERERRDGILDAASGDADDVEWPDWSRGLRDGG